MLLQRAYSFNSVNIFVEFCYCANNENYLYGTNAMCHQGFFFFYLSCLNSARINFLGSKQNSGRFSPQTQLINSFTSHTCTKMRSQNLSSILCLISSCNASWEKAVFSRHGRSWGSTSYTAKRLPCLGKIAAAFSRKHCSRK